MPTDGGAAGRWIARLRPAAVLDVGTVWTRMGAPGQPLIEERSQVAVCRATGEVLAWGDKARDRLARDGVAVRIEHPVRAGVIANLNGYAYILQDLLLRARGTGLRGRLVHPRVLMAVVPDLSSVEQTALQEAGRRVVGGKLHLIQSSRAAAAGADVPIGDVAGTMVVEAGGGFMAATVFCRGAVVVRRVMRTGGLAIDDGVRMRLRRDYGLWVGRETARVATEMRAAEAGQMLVRGMDTKGGLPRSVPVQCDDVYDVARPLVDRLCDLVADVLAQTPPELAGDLLSNGITVVGGMARMASLADAIGRFSGCPVRVPPDPEHCVVRGLAALGGVSWCERPAV